MRVLLYLAGQKPNLLPAGHLCVYLFKIHFDLTYFILKRAQAEKLFMFVSTW